MEFALATDQEQLKLTQRATSIARRTISEVRRRVEAAKSPAVEQNRAQIALIRAEVEQEHAAHELLSSRRKLAAMWGEREPSFGSVDADLFRLPEIREFVASAQTIGGNPDQLRFISEARLRDAELRLAESRARAHLTLSVGIRRLQDTDDTAFVAGVSVPLFAARQARQASPKPGHCVPAWIRRRQQRGCARRPRCSNSYRNCGIRSPRPAHCATASCRKWKPHCSKPNTPTSAAGTAISNGPKRNANCSMSIAV